MSWQHLDQAVWKLSMQTARSWDENPLASMALEEQHSLEIAELGDSLAGLAKLLTLAHITRNNSKNWCFFCPLYPSPRLASAFKMMCSTSPMGSKRFPSVSQTKVPRNRSHDESHDESHEIPMVHGEAHHWLSTPSGTLAMASEDDIAGAAGKQRMVEVTWRIYHQHPSTNANIYHEECGFNGIFRYAWDLCGFWVGFASSYRECSTCFQGDSSQKNEDRAMKQRDSIIGGIRS